MSLQKEIHIHYLKLRYLLPSLKGVRNIGIDEFAVRKGHVYKTIVVDLEDVSSTSAMAKTQSHWLSSGTRLA